MTEQVAKKQAASVVLHQELSSRRDSALLLPSTLCPLS